MKKIYSLLMVSCMVFFAACKPDPVVEPDDPKPEPKDSTEQIVPKTEWEMADSTINSAWALFRMPASKSFWSSLRRVMFDTVMLSVEMFTLTPESKKAGRG